jgi:acetyl-CoA carboxylase biotin carboxyl carrier protein
MQLDHDQLRELLTFLGESDIQELRLEGEDFRLVVRRNLPTAAPTAEAAPPLPVVTAAAPTPPVPVAAAVPSPPPPSSRSDLQPLTAPMVGTFYRSPAPGEPAFVELGSRIQAGQPVCILEAMKLMNELEADISGEVVEILVDSGTPVEFGQVLMRIRPA